MRICRACGQRRKDSSFRKGVAKCYTCVNAARPKTESSQKNISATGRPTTLKDARLWWRLTSSEELVVRRAAKAMGVVSKQKPGTGSTCPVETPEQIIDARTPVFRDRVRLLNAVCDFALILGHFESGSSREREYQRRYKARQRALKQAQKEAA